MKHNLKCRIAVFSFIVSSIFISCSRTPERFSGVVIDFADEDTSLLIFEEIVRDRMLSYDYRKVDISHVLTDGKNFDGTHISCADMVKQFPQAAIVIGSAFNQFLHPYEETSAVLDEATARAFSIDFSERYGSSTPTDDLIMSFSQVLLNKRSGVAVLFVDSGFESLSDGWCERGTSAVVLVREGKAWTIVASAPLRYSALVERSIAYSDWPNLTIPYSYDFEYVGIERKGASGPEMASGTVYICEDSKTIIEFHSRVTPDLDALAASHITKGSPFVYIRTPFVLATFNHFGEPLVKGPHLKEYSSALNLYSPFEDGALYPMINGAIAVPRPGLPLELGELFEGVLNGSGANNVPEFAHFEYDDMKIIASRDGRTVDVDYYKDSSIVKSTRIHKVLRLTHDDTDFFATEDGFWYQGRGVSVYIDHRDKPKGQNE